MSIIEWSPSVSSYTEASCNVQSWSKPGGSLQFFRSFMSGVTPLPLHLFYQHLYFMCAEWRETLRPKQQHSCPSISQTSHYSTKRARTPNEPLPRGSSLNRSPEVRLRWFGMRSKSTNVTLEDCTDVWTRMQTAVIHSAAVTRSLWRRGGLIRDTKTSTHMH